MKNCGAMFIILTVLLFLACSAERNKESHASMVRNALTRMLNRPHGAFVIIEESKTGKFVQFTGSKTEQLLLDLPADNLSPSEMQKAKSLFIGKGGPGLETHNLLEYPGGPSAGSMTIFNLYLGKDVEKATTLAVAVLHDVYGFDETAKLKLKEN